MKSKIKIEKDYSEVTPIHDRRFEEKISERLAMYRNIGLSDEAVLSRMRIYKGRWHTAHLKCTFATRGYVDECGVMMEVYRILAEERGLI